VKLATGVVITTLTTLHFLHNLQMDGGACFDCSCRWMQFYKLPRKNEFLSVPQRYNGQKTDQDKEEHVVDSVKSSPRISFKAFRHFWSFFKSRRSFSSGIFFSLLKNGNLATYQNKLGRSVHRMESVIESTQHRLKRNNNNKNMEKGILRCGGIETSVLLLYRKTCSTPST
jgi:hypothetical protein